MSAKRPRSHSSESSTSPRHHSDGSGSHESDSDSYSYSYSSYTASSSSSDADSDYSSTTDSRSRSRSRSQGSRRSHSSSSSSSSLSSNSDSDTESSNVVDGTEPTEVADTIPVKPRFLEGDIFPGEADATLGDTSAGGASGPPGGGYVSSPHADVSDSGRQEPHEGDLVFPFAMGSIPLDEALDEDVMPGGVSDATTAAQAADAEGVYSVPLASKGGAGSASAIDGHGVADPARGAPHRSDGDLLLAEPLSTVQPPGQSDVVRPKKRKRVMWADKPHDGDRHSAASKQGSTRALVHRATTFAMPLPRQSTSHWPSLQVLAGSAAGTQQTAQPQAVQSSPAVVQTHTNTDGSTYIALRALRPSPRFLHWKVAAHRAADGGSSTAPFRAHEAALPETPRLTLFAALHPPRAVLPLPRQRMNTATDVSVGMRTAALDKTGEVLENGGLVVPLFCPGLPQDAPLEILDAARVPPW